MGNSLEGKVALVTGAGRGLGKSYAIDMAKEGARIVIADLGVGKDGDGTDQGPAQGVVEEIKGIGGDAIAVFGDVGNYNDASRTIQSAIETFGDLNIVVNNAGFCRDKMIFSMSEEEFDSVIRVHLKGHFNFISQTCSYWRQRAKDGKPVYGRLINTASEAFLYGSVGQANYASAKAGIMQLTLVAAQAMGKYGITSNAIAPRARTVMTDEGLTAQMFAKPEEGFDAFNPDNVAPFVTYLASPMAEKISGNIFVVWGKQVTVIEKPTAGEVFVNDEDTRWTVEGLDAKLSPYFDKKQPVVDGFAMQPF
jgi:3-oxoacyl-[acyl-carrier protein] reductase